MMLIIQNLTYIHPDKELLFKNINLTVNRHDKIALIGNNGTGKSTLLKIAAGIFAPTDGQVYTDNSLYYLPQIFGQYNHLTVAQALKIESKLHALNEILDGNMTEANLALLNDDWTIEERCAEALRYWQLENLDLSQKMETLSGGQKTKIFLAGIFIHQPELVLLDEPSNHLDTSARKLLYDFIRFTSSALLVVSHDRTLLNLLDLVYELSKFGISVYGGNYDFYATQKEIENQALLHNVKSKEKELHKAGEKERETLERQQKLNARGKKQHKKEGMPKIMMNKLKNDAQKTTSRLKDAHTEKINVISQALNELKNELSDIDRMKLDFDNSMLHKGKILICADNINFGYGNRLLWEESLSFRLSSGERIALKGLNGSGKTTLIKIILGEIEPVSGKIYRAGSQAIYIDQDYSLISNQFTVYEQSQQFNRATLQEHEIKTRLNRFLFAKDDWEKPCEILSGGEKMRLMLCCLTLNHRPPDIIILDEPTNNLDIQNIEILINAISDYQGTLIVVSHDEYFLKKINAEREICL
ncbi:MAG: ATP-binding cassette domain-containing protein [Prevotellaceae bacterium]|nr:ATP-binding cassette domain-containing protein [Prevotellaceae bacterium]